MEIKFPCNQMRQVFHHPFAWVWIGCTISGTLYMRYNPTHDTIEVKIENIASAN